MIFHAKAATCMPGHALELFVPALMLLRACATMHAAHTHAAGRGWATSAYLPRPISS